MAFPILMAVRLKNPSEIADKVALGGCAFDTAVGITLFVVGMLGANSILKISPATAYALIGTGVTLAVSSLLWLISAQMEPEST